MKERLNYIITCYICKKIKKETVLKRNVMKSLLEFVKIVRVVPAIKKENMYLLCHKVYSFVR